MRGILTRNRDQSEVPDRRAQGARRALDDENIQIASRSGKRTRQAHDACTHYDQVVLHGLYCNFSVLVCAP